MSDTKTEKSIVDRLKRGPATLEELQCTEKDLQSLIDAGIMYLLAFNLSQHRKPSSDENNDPNTQTTLLYRNVPDADVDILLQIKDLKETAAKLNSDIREMKSNCLGKLK
jgi:hypothetical protein